jgi:hypothetical protein
MRVCLSRCDMVNIQPHALLQPEAACHARLVAVFGQDLIPDPGPCVGLEKLPSGRMRQLAIMPPEPDALDEVKHSCIQSFMRPRIHLINRSVPSARSMKWFHGTITAIMSAAPGIDPSGFYPQHIHDALSRLEAQCVVQLHRPNAVWLCDFSHPFPQTSIHPLMHLSPSTQDRPRIADAQPTPEDTVT